MYFIKLSYKKKIFGIQAKIKIKIFFKKSKKLVLLLLKNCLYNSGDFFSMKYDFKYNSLKILINHIKYISTEFVGKYHIYDLNELY